MTRQHAYKLREMMHKAAVSLDDKDASAAAELFPRMKYDGSLIPYQTRINWNGTVKMAAPIHSISSSAHANSSTSTPPFRMLFQSSMPRTTSSRTWKSRNFRRTLRSTRQNTA